MNYGRNTRVNQYTSYQGQGRPTYVDCMHTKRILQVTKLRYTDKRIVNNSESVHRKENRATIIRYSQNYDHFGSVSDSLG